MIILFLTQLPTKKVLAECYVCGETNQGDSCIGSKCLSQPTGGSADCADIYELPSGPGTKVECDCIVFGDKCRGIRTTR